MSVDHVEDIAGASYLTKEHTDLLANSWWTVKEFKEHRIACCNGPFTESEAQQFREALDYYRKVHKLSPDNVEDLIYGVATCNGFWEHISENSVCAVPQRRVQSVYDHMQCANHTSKKQGKWQELQDVRLKDKAKVGRKLAMHWTVLPKTVAINLKCIYREQIHNAKACLNIYSNPLKTDRSAGAWTTDEAAHLNHIMQELCEHSKTPEKLDRYWVKVSERMDNTHTAKQCCNKWNSSITQWHTTDTKILVHKVVQLDLDKEDNIQWDELIDTQWNRWTGTKLQQKWVILRKTVNSPAAMHQGIVQQLTSQYSTPHASKSS
ncbi:hypothetical protein V8E53_000917 [Lactarius tabidus]